jgi:hypothetical protein
MLSDPFPSRSLFSPRLFFLRVLHPLPAGRVRWSMRSVNQANR